MKLKKVLKCVGRVIAKIAKKSASVETNTACTLWGYQPKDSKQAKALRKF